MKDFTAPTESHNTTSGNAGRGGLQPPHTVPSGQPAAGADDSGEHVRNRMLSVKLDLRGRDDLYRRFIELAWQAARYWNLFLRARWAEAMKLCVDPVKAFPHDITKHIRATEKMDLSSVVYAAMEREADTDWRKHVKRILRGGPLPERSPNASLSIRGHKDRARSGVRLSEPAGKFVAHLMLQNESCEGGCWFEVPVAQGTEKDWQVDLIRGMVSGEVPILKGVVVFKKRRRQVILRLCYAQTIQLPRFGNRCATLGPIRDGARLTLRTECETRDYTGRLHSLLDRKSKWDDIRRRAGAQIGKTKGSARAKRKKFAQWSWQDWLDTHLHQWSREIIDWLDSQGIAKLSVIGLGTEDWPVYRFVQLLKYKGEAIGITVSGEADLAEPGTERAVKRELDHQRRKATKKAGAILTLSQGVGRG